MMLHCLLLKRIYTPNELLLHIWKVSFEYIAMSLALCSVFVPLTYVVMPLFLSCCLHYNNSTADFMLNGVHLPLYIRQVCCWLFHGLE